MYIIRMIIARAGQGCYKRGIVNSNPSFHLHQHLQSSNNNQLQLSNVIMKYYAIILIYSLLCYKGTYVQV